jgi:hypothetical protein
MKSGRKAIQHVRPRVRTRHNREARRWVQFVDLLQEIKQPVTQGVGVDQDQIEALAICQRPELKRFDYMRVLDCPFD